MAFRSPTPSARWWSTGEIQVLFSLVLAALFIYLGTLAIKTYKESDVVNKPAPYINSVSVVGTGIIHVIPDIATVSAGVETTAPTVAEAQKTNTEKMNAFIQKIAILGIPDTDRRTTAYNVSPNYEYQQATKDAPSKQVLIGYTVSQTLEVKVRRLPSLGDVLKSIGDAGLNQVGSFTFTVDNEEAIKKQALDAAIQDAQEKATILSRTSGTRLGKLTSFYENPETPYPMNTDMSGGAGGGAAPAPTPQTGGQDISVSVTLSYEIK